MSSSVYGPSSNHLLHSASQDAVKSAQPATGYTGEKSRSYHRLKSHLQADHWSTMVPEPAFKNESRFINSDTNCQGQSVLTKSFLNALTKSGKLVPFFHIPTLVSRLRLFGYFWGTTR